MYGLAAAADAQIYVQQMPPRSYGTYAYTKDSNTSALNIIWSCFSHHFIFIDMQLIFLPLHVSLFVLFIALLLFRGLDTKLHELT